MHSKGRASRLALGLAILIGYLVIAEALLDASAFAGLPPLTLDKAVVAPGASVTIEGWGWPGPRELQAAVCGAGIESVSPDCDLSHAITFGPENSGTFVGHLIVTIPPVPCPCVVMITQMQPSGVERLPITIEGATTAPVPAPLRTVHPNVLVTDVHVLSDSSWTSWFGAAAPRRLVMTVHNLSSSSVQPLLVAQWTQGSAHFVVTSPRPEVLAPGRAAQVSAAFNLSTFSAGSFSVTGRITGAGFERAFATSTTTAPRGLYVVAVASAVTLLLMLAVFIGRRANRPHPEEEAAIPTDDLQIPTAPLSQIGALQ